jgi:hypothetical protein
MRLPIFTIIATGVLFVTVPNLVFTQDREKDVKDTQIQAQLEVQKLPDAPMPLMVAPAPALADPTGSIWHQNFYRYYAIHHRSNREVLHNKTFYMFATTDILVSSFDAEMSRHQGHCTEGAPGLGPHPTRWGLYSNNLPENAAAILFGFIATKSRMPTWLMFPTLAYPVAVHVRGGLSWWENCW